MKPIQLGLLWYDDEAGTLEDKVQRAAHAYQKKHGEPPDTCYVNPCALAEGQLLSISQRMGGGMRRWSSVAVEPLATILPNHFWLGRATAEVEA